MSSTAGSSEETLSEGASLTVAAVSGVDSTVGGANSVCGANAERTTIDPAEKARVSRLARLLRGDVRAERMLIAVLLVTSGVP
jgi:hypothetical protein